MKTPRRYTVLAVDDDEINLMILTKCVQETGFTVKSFESGDAAWEFLVNNPKAIDIALVDKMMPGLSGLELLKRIKGNDMLRHIPVIIQTGDVGVAQMSEGLTSGAYYYLTKPFHPHILSAILNSAANECAMREELLLQASADHAQFMHLMHEGDFVIKTHAEAGILASTISQAAVYPEFIAVGLMEILSNAIEHGNLDIGYQRKNRCLVANRWKEEIENRMNSAQYGMKVVHVHLEKNISGLHVIIRDEGKGFDWTNYMYQDQPSGNLSEPNGRGIAKAFIMLDDLRYADNGNEVHCNVSLATPKHHHDEHGAADARPMAQ